MKKTSQLPKDDSLMENRDTLAYGEQSVNKIQQKSDDFADGPDEDETILSGENDLSDEADTEDDEVPVLTEEDLEENDLTAEEAEDLEWEEKKRRVGK